MRRLVSILVPVALTLAVAFGTWRVLNRRPPKATWLHVEAPRQADAGLAFPVRVTLDPEAGNDADEDDNAAKFVHVDLHGYTRAHEWRGSIVSAAPQAMGDSRSPYEFSLQVPQRADLRYVAILVYLSPTGRWDDHTAAASSLEIWYRPDPTGPPLLKHERIAMYPQIPGSPIERRDVRAISMLIALGWIFCGTQAWRAGWRANLGGRRHRLLPFAAALAAAWELLPLERALGTVARTIVSGLHLYNMRMGFQQLVTAGVAALAAAAVYRTLRHAETPGLRLQIIGLTLYAAITLAGFLSLHLVDAIFAQTILSVPLMQWVQLVAMLTATAGTIGGMLGTRARSH